MSLKDDYADVLKLGEELGAKNGNVTERDGKIHISGRMAHQLDANRIWDKIKTHPNWKDEVVADITAEQTDVFGVHTVQSGETLSKIAKEYLGDANRYNDIFSINKDVLKDPDRIQPGQKLKIPNR